MLPLKGLRVLLVVFLFKLVLGGYAVTMETIAARGSTTRAVLAVVVLLEFLGARTRRGSLNIAQMRVHGHTLTDFGNTMVIFDFLATIANRDVGT